MLLPLSQPQLRWCPVFVLCGSDSIWAPYWTERSVDAHRFIHSCVVMFWHGCISDLHCKYEYCSLAELSAKPCQTLPNCAKSFQISPDCGIYLCRTWWITRIWHTLLARNGPKFTRICTYIALRFQNFPRTRDDTFWLVFGGPYIIDEYTLFAIHSVVFGVMLLKWVWPYYACHVYLGILLCTMAYYWTNHAMELWALCSMSTMYCTVATTQHYGALWTFGWWLWWPNNRGLYNQATSTMFTPSDGGVLWVFPLMMLMLLKFLTCKNWGKLCH